MPRVDLYFDYISPYSYLGWVELRALCREKGAELVAHPVLFAGLLHRWGQLGPAEVEPKRRWIFADASRCARLRSISFVCPKAHPFNPLTALRLSLPSVCGGRQHDVIDAIYRAGWGRGIDLGSPAELAAALEEAGLPGAALIEKAGLPESKQGLEESTDAAIELGVFGAPTMIVTAAAEAPGELFWGSDRVEHVALALEGRDPIDRGAVDEVLARPRAADRRGVSASR